VVVITYCYYYLLIGWSAEVSSRVEGEPSTWKYYVHYHDFNRRMDEWVGTSDCDDVMVMEGGGDSRKDECLYCPIMLCMYNGIRLMPIGCLNPLQ